jgi:hypothetical protein
MRGLPYSHSHVPVIFVRARSCLWQCDCCRRMRLPQATARPSVTHSTWIPVPALDPGASLIPLNAACRFWPATAGSLSRGLWLQPWCTQQKSGHPLSRWSINRLNTAIVPDMLRCCVLPPGCGSTTASLLRLYLHESGLCLRSAIADNLRSSLGELSDGSNDLSESGQ